MLDDSYFACLLLDFCLGTFIAVVPSAFCKVSRFSKWITIPRSSWLCWKLLEELPNFLVKMHDYVHIWPGEAMLQKLQRWDLHLLLQQRVSTVMPKSGRFVFFYQPSPNNWTMTSTIIDDMEWIEWIDGNNIIIMVWINEFFSLPQVLDRYLVYIHQSINN